jgi:hypothetical protein
MVPDYYVRLGVDPTASAAEIEAALRKQQPAWSMGTRNPKTRHANQLFLDEVPALRRALLSSPEARQAYDAELAAAQVAEREQRLDELQRRVRLRAAKGGLTPADRVLLREEAGRLGLTDESVDRLTRLIPSWAGVDVADLAEDAQDAPPPDVLDPSTRRQIQAALDHLACRDLYDALGLPRDTPSTLIAARADEERQRWMRKTQVTAEKTAWLEVISHAQSHLTSPRARARYDRTLRLKAEERFEAAAAFALKGLKRLDAGTRGALVEEAAAFGIGSQDAGRLIARACRKAGVTQDQGSVPPAVPAVHGGANGSHPGPPNGAYPQVRCRSCSGLTEVSPVARRSGSGRCRHCGASLKWDCPVCRRAHWVDERKCDCGFPLALREPLVQHFAAAQQAFRNYDLVTAREYLRQVQKYAPRHAGARNGMARIRQHEADIEYARMAWELAVAGRKLVAARQAAEAWRKLVGPEQPEVRGAWREAVSGLRQAEALAARARKLERVDPPAAREHYRRSLEIAADLPEALAGLNRCPPDAPSGLDARMHGDRIKLSWTPPPPDGLGPLTFAIMRKRGSLPLHPGDGTRIAEVSTCEFEDRKVRPGETVSYAVLSKRGEAESLAAVAAGPLVFLPDVHDVLVQPRDGEVELSWIPPHGVFEVRVVRKAGQPPSGPRDGERIAAGLDQALDSGLREGDVYHYGIYAIYRMPDGQRYPSAGVVVAAIPRPQAPAPAAPRVLLTPSGHARLDWAEPVQGPVRILRTDRPLGLSPGTQIGADEAERLGGRWIALSGSDRAEDPEPPAAGSCAYTPVIAHGGVFTVGPSAVLSRLADPTDLRARRIGSPGADSSAACRAQLRWIWPDGATTTRLVARLGSPPTGADDPEAVVTTVRRDEYDRLSSWVMSLPLRGPAEAPGPEPEPEHPPGDTLPEGRLGSGLWFIRAFSVAEQDGASIVSPGLEPTASTAVPGPHPDILISYSLKRPWLPGQPWTLTLRAEPAGSKVPPMVLVSNPRATPLSAEDGEIIARIPACPDGAVHPIRTAVKLSKVGVRAFPDLSGEAAFSPPVRVRHPEAGAPRF